MTEIVPTPFEFDGECFFGVLMPNGDFGIPLSSLVAPIDISLDAQRRLIERSAWSKGRTTKMVVQVPNDSQARLHFVISYRIIPMWIANIEPSRLKDDATRKRIERWQVELADALYDYVLNGGAINPRATADQLDQLGEDIQRAKAAAEVIATLAGVGVGDRGYWDACGRRLAGRLMGETPQLDPLTKPLTVSMYLESKGLSGTEIKRLASSFGKALKKLYVNSFGEAPPQIEDLVGRHVTLVAQYQERHRPLFDQVYNMLVVP
ncbi:phage antirepressor N-terminal domain-containing protein [Streptosporangium sp. NBC_01755]|uniref:phage antirepressor N-terminal domain-containing protein n=1 Tax=Streptosporangium sp. NBC_01755 TaxID=2975949 RepID=UPI002DD8AD3A|nr:phage antirepressor N-terminal domain-containing protein [Streptosporangium sp. NBC_01755]WSD02600.1 phage antirepressor N-terminal domain-containing protein [Streptosporangium sp. NBC_01755]